MKMLMGLLTVLMLATSSIYATESFTLDTAKNQVVNDNINVAIAYQNYVTVKEQANVKTMQILPTLSVDLLVTDYQYTILRSVIPEPSKFFDAAAAKDLAKAASVNRTIVKKNLLEDLEKTYFLHQFHKEMVESLKQEVATRTELVERVREAYDLGATSFDDFYRNQRTLVEAKQNLASANQVLVTDEYALKLILQTNNLSPIDLALIDFYNATLSYSTDVNAAMESAVINSKEIEQYDYLIEAAKNTKKGVVLSFISWNGVGFDYFARVSVAKSEITKLQLQKQKTEIETRNQVAAQYETIQKQIEKIALQEQLVAMAKDYLAKAQENYNNQLGTVVQVKNAEISVVYSERDLRRFQYELELKYIHLKRILGSNLLTNEVPRA